jgi:hypothetical protein
MAGLLLLLIRWPSEHRWGASAWTRYSDSILPKQAPFYLHLADYLISVAAMGWIKQVQAKELEGA